MTLSDQTACMKKFRGVDIQGMPATVLSRVLCLLVYYLRIQSLKCTLLLKLHVPVRANKHCGVS